MSTNITQSLFKTTQVPKRTAKKLTAEQAALPLVKKTQKRGVVIKNPTTSKKAQQIILETNQKSVNLPKPEGHEAIISQLLESSDDVVQSSQSQETEQKSSGKKRCGRTASTKTKADKQVMNKSSKRAWDDEQDLKLLNMIAEIGPLQWEQMALQMEQRSGKQCRERWHNQLNPLLKKANWTVEEDWILYILHQTVKNRWAEITNVLLGRSDNSIKNYWNSTLVHKQQDLEKDLNSYLKQAIQDVDQAGIPKKKQQVMQGLLQYYIHVAQSQYFDYIRDKIVGLKLEPVLDSSEKINPFKIKLMEHALTPENDLQRQCETSQLAGNFQNQANATRPSTIMEPKLKAMLELRELKQFYKIFLQNQLCRNLQSAMTDLKSKSSMQMASEGPIPSLKSDAHNGNGKGQILTSQQIIGSFLPETQEQPQEDKVVTCGQIQSKRGAKILNKMAKSKAPKKKVVTKVVDEPLAVLKVDSTQKLVTMAAAADQNNSKDGLSIVNNITNNYIYMNTKQQGTTDAVTTAVKDNLALTPLEKAVPSIEVEEIEISDIIQKESEHETQIVKQTPEPATQEIQNLNCTAMISESKQRSVKATKQAMTPNDPKIETPQTQLTGRISEDAESAPSSAKKQKRVRKHKKTRSGRYLPEAPIPQTQPFFYSSQQSFISPQDYSSQMQPQQESCAPGYYQPPMPMMYPTSAAFNYYNSGYYAHQQWAAMQQQYMMAQQGFYGVPQPHQHQSHCIYSQANMQGQHASDSTGYSNLGYWQEEEAEEVIDDDNHQSSSYTATVTKTHCQKSDNAQGHVDQGHGNNMLMDHQESIDLSCNRRNLDLSYAFGSPRVYQKTVKSSISSNAQPIGLATSIAEKPKSQEYNKFMAEHTNSVRRSWQEEGLSKQAAGSWPCPMNDFSEHCHMNTFVNKEKALDYEHRRHQVVTPGLANYASEDSHLSSDLDTYQCVMTPNKRFRRI